MTDFVGAFVRGKLKITAKEAYIRLGFIQNRRELSRQIVRSFPKPLASIAKEAPGQSALGTKRF